MRTNLILFTFLFLQTINSIGQSSVQLIPQPVSVIEKNGSFKLNSNTNIFFDLKNPEIIKVAKYINRNLDKILGYKLEYKKNDSNSIILKIVQNPQIGEEGYLLNITDTKIEISGNSSIGIFYGVQSLFQMLPPIRTNEKIALQCLDIIDFPRFKWRGLHLDVSRHFFSTDAIKDIIDIISSYKINKFHWHLTDDQGWRIEIKKYPLLTQIGAWRVDQNDKIWESRPQATNTENPTYGGFYTQDQIKDVVLYARQRNVTIIPEIEMPGHSAAAIASYPYLSCNKNHQLPMTGGNYNNISSNFCAGNDSTFSFLHDVLDEIITLFPSKYIHIGGDEVDKTSWRNCQVCQSKIKQEHLKNEDELQSYFIKKIESYLKEKNKKLIGWDEILEGGLAPEATVMSWRGESGGLKAAALQHDVIMTPGFPLYFNQYQGDPEIEPIAIGGFNTLRNVYNYDPISKELDSSYKKYILGAQANIWTEYIKSISSLQYMLLPRLLALSEGVWSPSNIKNWIFFQYRLQNHLSRFDKLGIQYSNGNNKIEITPFIKNGILFAKLESEAYKSEIHYTIDGSMPNTQSSIYNEPLKIDSTIVVKAINVKNERNVSILPSSQSFVIHKAIGKNITYKYEVNKSYNANGNQTLIDGIRGNENISKFWHGFLGVDFEATIDLKDITSINTISVGFIQKYRDWIMMPTSVTYEFSNDGLKFSEIETVVNDISTNEKKPIIKNFISNTKNLKARYIKVSAKNLGSLPVNHPGQGQKPWLFIDEIVIN